MALRPRFAAAAEVRTRRTTALAGLALLLAACGSAPPVPAWRSDAKADIDQAVSAYLLGDSRGEARSFERARSEIASTGQPALMARAELMRCAAHVASLDYAPCTGYQQWQADAEPAERAYAAYLAAQALPADQIERLPAAQQPTAQAVAHHSAGELARLQAIDDPLARLISIGVLFEAGQAGPDVIALATDTASAQGWRRPLLGWLKVQAELAQRAGDAAAQERLQRRIALVEAGLPGSH